jgi:hypothetical protein
MSRPGSRQMGCLYLLSRQTWVGREVGPFETPPLSLP